MLQTLRSCALHLALRRSGPRGSLVAACGARCSGTCHSLPYVCRVLKLTSRRLELAERLAEAVQERAHQVAHSAPLPSPDEDVRVHPAQKLQVTVALQLVW